MIIDDICFICWKTLLTSWLLLFAVTFKIIYSLLESLVRSFVILIVFLATADISLFLSFYPHNYFSGTNEFASLYWSTTVQEGLYPSSNPSHQSVDRVYLYACMRMHTMHLVYDTRRRTPRQATIPKSSSELFCLQSREREMRALLCHRKLKENWQ